MALHLKTLNMRFTATEINSTTHTPICIVANNDKIARTERATAIPSVVSIKLLQNSILIRFAKYAVYFQRTSERKSSLRILMSVIH